MAEEMEFYDVEYDGPPEPKSYSGRFGLAADLLREKRWARAGYQAKLNLMDLWLPRFWQIKNCIIIISSEDNWNEAQTSRTLTDRQTYIDITEELWKAARAELGDEIDTWPPSFRACFERLKEDQEEQREKCNPPPKREEQEHEFQEGEGLDLWPYDDEDYLEGMDDDQYYAALDEWDSEDERRDRSKEPDALMALRMTLEKPKAVVDDIVAIESAQLQQRVNFEVREEEEEEEEPQQELLDSPEREEEQESEPEAAYTWLARLSMAMQSVEYMY